MKTLDEVFDLYVKDLKRRKAKTIDSIQAVYQKNISPVLGGKPIDTIIRGDIASLHFDISERAPSLANKCLSIIKAVYNLAITLSLTEINPSSNIPKNRENKRKRYLTNDELIALTDELNKLKDIPLYQKSVAFIWLLILTGARKGEIAKAKWSDLVGNTLVIKDHKTDRYGEDRIIHLTPMAIDIINNLNKDDEYIIGIKTPRRTWETVKKAVGIEDMRMHDIRHSYASWSLQKISLAEVGGLLGHRDQATTQRYAHIHQDKAIESANRVGNHIESIINTDKVL
jgi:integrase|tara:strand:- start:310 stop:1164 length:855 start_codon:yes stop_codon:yes gene_type:complete